MSKDCVVSLPIYEINGEEEKGLHEKRLRLESHWNRYKDLVVVVTPDGKKYTVSQRDLSDAIRSCTL